MAEKKKIATGYIGNALRSVADNHTTTFTDEIFDTERQKYQNEVNTDLETTDNEIKADLEAETARAKAAEVAIIFDVSAHNNGAVFESLQALLSSSNLDTLIPVSFRHGGMTIRFIQGSEQSSDNKYVQYRLMSDTFNTTESNWQGVDDEPTNESENLVKSGGVANKLAELDDKIGSSEQRTIDITDKFVWEIDKFIIADGGNESSTYTPGLWKASNFVNISGAKSISITFPVRTSTSGAGLAFYDENKVYIANSGRNVKTGDVNSIQDYSPTIPNNAKYIRTTFWGSDEYGAFECSIQAEPSGIEFELKKENGFCYVSFNGSDDNDGSKERPFATFQHAINIGYKHIYAEPGKYSNQTINAANIQGLHIMPIKDSMYNRETDSYNRKARIIIDNSIDIAGNGFSGSGSVRKFALSQSETRTFYKVFISKTLQPVRSGSQSETYNAVLWEICNDWTENVKLKPVLTIEECTSTNGTFFWDGTYLYVNPTNGDWNGKSFKRLRIDDENGFGVQFNDCEDLVLEGIDVLYFPYNNYRFNNCNNASVKNCNSGYSANSTGFRPAASNITFVYCCAYKSASDGFAPVVSGNASFYDCTGIYNYDDGCSHHEGSEGVVDGGLYAYNGKAGVAPANGSLVSIKNVIAVYNKKYGLYWDNPDKERESRDLIIVGCTSLNNGLADLHIKYYNVLMANCNYKTKEIQFAKLDNIGNEEVRYSSAKFYQNRYINNVDGVEKESSGKWACSSYLPIAGCSSIEIRTPKVASASSASIAFYDVNRFFIGSKSMPIDIDGTQDRTFTKDSDLDFSEGKKVSDAYYMRATYWSDIKITEASYSAFRCFVKYITKDAEYKEEVDAKISELVSSINQIREICSNVEKKAVVYLDEICDTAKSGKIIFNPITKHIVKKDANGTTLQNYTPTNDGLYFVNGMYHRFDNSVGLLPIEAERKLVHLGVMSNTSGDFVKGKINYHNINKTLRYYAGDSYIFITLPFIEGALYEYDGIYYEYDKTELVPLSLRTYNKEVEIFGFYGGIDAAKSAGMINGQRYFNLITGRIVTLNNDTTSSEPAQKDVIYIWNGQKYCLVRDNIIVPMRGLEPKTDRLNGSISASTVPSMAQFTFDDAPMNEDDIDGFPPYAMNTLNQYYESFDSLMAEYPNYITKIDISQREGIVKPEYANYLTYMYKLSCKRGPNASNGLYIPKKMLVYACEHGDETGAAVNVYLLAKNLCKMADKNYFTLRNNFDIYIIPSLCGYGTNNMVRYNGNYVNVDRNYPTTPFVKTPQYIDGQPNRDYSGETGGSEYEVKTIISVIDELKPDIICSHHCYSYTSNFQLYGSYVNEDLKRLLYQSFVDTAYAIQKAYPQYFGGNDDMFNFQPGISNLTSTSTRWIAENGYLGGVLEICNCINYKNGVLNPNQSEREATRFSKPTFAVAQLTLKNYLCRLAEYVLKK